jgi:hypothetical protein
VPYTAPVRTALTIFAASTCVLGAVLLAWAWREACAAYALVLIGFPAWGLGTAAALAVIIPRGSPASWRYAGGWLLFANVACFALSWTLPLNHCS